MATEIKRIISRRDTAANWQSANPVLTAGEIGVDTTNSILKVGDGKTAWADLAEIFITKKVLEEYITSNQLYDDEEFSRTYGAVASLLSRMYESEDVAATYSPGYINKSGGVSDSAYAVHSDFIPMEADTILAVETTWSSAWYIAFYDEANEASFKFSRRFEESPNTRKVFIANPTRGCKYVRITKVPSGKAFTYPAKFSYLEALRNIEKLLSYDYSEAINTSWEPGYINSSGGVNASSVSEHSDFIAADASSIYTLRTTSSSAWHIGYYSAADESSFLSAEKYPDSSSSEVEVKLNVPSGAAYFRVTKSIYIHNSVIKTSKRYIDEPIADMIAPRDSYAGITKLGVVGNPPLYDKDMMYIPMYGQSFTTANDGGYKLTESFGSNLFMHAVGNPLGKGDTTLRPLATAQNTELVIADFANIFSRLLKEYTYRDHDILVGSYGMGSRSVMELSKGNAYGDGFHTYEELFEAGVSNAVAAAAASGKTISCPFILYLQGESDTVNERSTAATADSWCKGDRAQYKRYMLQLKEDMQNTVMASTGQTDRPLVFIYTCGNTSFHSKESGIQQACLELAAENDDIFVVGPYYYVSSMGAHPSPDGRRWLAEKFAKQVFETIVRGEDTTMRVEKVEVKGSTLTLRVKTPQPPLRIDTHTYPERKNYGFTLLNKVGAETTEITISSVEVQGDSIKITAASDLSYMDGLFVTYGSTAANGGGNICDSGAWRSMYTYQSNDNGNSSIVHFPVDDAGNDIIGKCYPMMSWMPQFGFFVKDKR